MLRQSLSLILLVGLFSTADAFAATTLPPAGTPLMTLNNKGTVVFGIEGAFLKTNAVSYTAVGQIPFAELGYLESPLGIPMDGKTVAPDSTFAKTIDLAYIFPGSNIDIAFLMQHLSVNAKANYADPATSFVLSPMAAGTAAAGADSQLNQLINTYDFTAGETFVVGTRVSLHPFLGLRITDIVDNLDNNYYNNQHIFSSNTSLYVNETDTIRNHFEGIGPRAGLNSSVRIYKGLSLVDTLGASLLIGKEDQSKTYFSPFAPTGIGTLGYSNHYQTVIPEWDAKLGLNYRIGLLQAEAGYEITSFYQVASVNGPQSQQIAPGVYDNVFLKSNLNYQGPYLRVQFNL